MCRLLGVIANKPVDLKFSLECFKNFAKRNPDGWGIGWYEEKGTAKVFKQRLSAVAEESKLPILSKEVRSKIIIAHVRKRTQGNASEKNSHPFQHKNWIFAHNGSVDKNYLWELLNDNHRNAIKGETDSEVYFHWILQCVKEEENVENGLRKAIEHVVKGSYSKGSYSRYTGLNFLLSDGKKLYAFRYSSHSKNYYALFELKREPTTSGPMELLSKETASLIRSKSLKREKSILVCSEKLTEEEWKSIKLGNLLVINPDLNVREVNMI
ncbi:MAG: class II glutamine amidotransferase [Candidatus Eremiobacteraeota bacterium]|nr:class II glutamine amidotransferase [Candidatus Eremiobacteraeota bacterium]